MEQYRSSTVDPITGFLHDHCYESERESLDLCESDTDTAFVERSMDPQFVSNVSVPLLSDSHGGIPTSPVYNSHVGTSDPMLTDGPIWRNQQCSIIQCPAVSSTTSAVAETGILPNALPYGDHRMNDGIPLSYGSGQYSSNGGTNLVEKPLRMSSNRFETFPFYCPSNNNVSTTSTDLSYKPESSSTNDSVRSLYDRKGPTIYIKRNVPSFKSNGTDTMEQKRKITVTNAGRPKMAPFRFYKANDADTGRNRQTSMHFNNKPLHRGHGFVNITSPDVMNKMRLMYDGHSSRKPIAPYSVPVNLPSNKIRAAVPKPIVNSLPEHSHDAQYSQLCSQTKAIVSRLFNFNKNYAKSLGNDAKFSLWEQPDKLTATMTGLELATVKECEMASTDVDESWFKYTDRNLFSETAKRTEGPENEKKVYAKETGALIAGSSESIQAIVNRNQPETMKRKSFADNDYAFNAKPSQFIHNMPSTNKICHVIPNILRHNYTNSKHLVRSVVGKLVDSVCKEVDSKNKLNMENDLDKTMASSSTSDGMVLRQRSNLRNWKQLSDSYDQM